MFKRVWLPQKKNQYNPILFKRLLIYGMPMAAAALIEEITLVTDRFMLASLSGKADAGLYAVGSDLAGNSILMIIAAICAAKKTITSVKIAAFIGVTNFILNYLLIPTMNIKGAAIATLLSFALGCIVSAIVGRRYFAMPLPFKDLLKIIVASLFMTACMWNLIDLRGVGWLAVQLIVGIVSIFVNLDFVCLDSIGLDSGC